MSNITNIHALPVDDKLWGALVNIQVEGGLDAILQLPPGCDTEQKADKFLKDLLVKVHTGNTQLTDGEQAFVNSIVMIAKELMAQGLCFKPLKLFSPSDLSEAMSLAMRRLNASKN